MYLKNSTSAVVTLKVPMQQYHASMSYLLVTDKDAELSWTGNSHWAIVKTGYSQISKYMKTEKHGIQFSQEKIRSKGTLPAVNSIIPSLFIKNHWKRKKTKISVNTAITLKYYLWSSKVIKLTTWHCNLLLKDALGHCRQLQLEWFLRTDNLGTS